jgi:hypothetical protein
MRTHSAEIVPPARFPSRHEPVAGVSFSATIRWPSSRSQ